MLEVAYHWLLDQDVDVVTGGEYPLGGVVQAPQ